MSDGRSSERSEKAPPPPPPPKSPPPSKAYDHKPKKA
jgi:hypothetical protein